MTPMSPAAAQWLINILLAMGHGDVVSEFDQDKAATILCASVKDPKGDRVHLTIGRYQLYCNNAPPRFVQ